MNTILAFAIIFGALVFFHELGHLIFAKRAGMLAREFAIGFGPKVLSFTKNETLYTIRLLPLGGFVRVAGEDPEMVEIKPGYNVGLVLDYNEKVKKIIVNKKDKYQDLRIIEVEQIDLIHQLFIQGYEEGSDELKTFNVDEKAFIVMDGQETLIAPFNRQFGSKTIGQRAMQIFAGPMMNFLLAIVAFIFIGISLGVPSDQAVLGDTINDKPANEAGLQKGDRIVAIENEQIENWADMDRMIKANPSKEIIFEIERDGENLKVPVIPEEVATDAGEKIGRIGVYQHLEKSVVGSFQYGFEQTYLFTKLILVGLGKLVTGSFSIDMLSGPVGIYDTTDKVAKTGIYSLIKWGALLSINLGIINLLPLPALDGGRLLFLGIELVRGKPIDAQKEGIVHFIGFALLMLLMLVVTWNDIQRLIN